MRMEAFIRKALRLKAYRVVTIEEHEGAGALTVYLDRIGAPATVTLLGDQPAFWGRPFPTRFWIGS